MVRAAPVIPAAADPEVGHRRDKNEQNVRWKMREHHRVDQTPSRSEAGRQKRGNGRSFSSCKIEYRELGQELVTRAMDRMKVLGMGRFCF